MPAHDRGTDYLLRVWVKDVEALRDFIRDVLQSIPVVAEISTMVILAVNKSIRALDAVMASRIC